MKRHSASVVTYVVWHPAFKHGAVLARRIFAFLNRDLEAPEARAVGIPVYFRSTSLPGGDLPLEIKPAPGTLSFVILLVDRQMGVDPHWRRYIDKLLARLPKGHVLPCLFTQVTAELSPAFNSLNSVLLQLAKVSKAEQSRRVLHEISHALSRLLLQPRKASGGALPPPPISLFVSHAKRDGVPFAAALRDFILTQTQGSAFFDVNRIAPGFPFDVQIFTEVAHSALIVIQTDAYASREWCRREVIEAKRRGRPIVVLNAVQKGEERSFPYLGNVPTLRWTPQKQSIQETCRALVDMTLREVLHAAFFEREIAQLKALYPVLARAQILTRPPELLTAPPLKRGARPPPVIYPDPPIGDEELEVLAPYHGPALTPVLLPRAQHRAKPQGLFPQEWTFGISIGHPEPEELIVRGLEEENIQEATIECARYLLAHGVRLAYGGNLQLKGFTEQLANLGEASQPGWGHPVPPAQALSRLARASRPARRLRGLGAVCPDDPRASPHRSQEQGRRTTPTF